MKTFFIGFALLAVLLAVYPLFFDDSDSTKQVEGLPWQIEIGMDGASTVFGITPGKSTLADVVAVLGNDAELAIVETIHAESAKATSTNVESNNVEQSKGEAGLANGKLEMYFGHYRASLISGKMILQADVAPDTLKRWKEAAVRVDYMKSGLARKYLLDSDNLPMIMQSVVANITFIPAVNLDEETIIGRFGEPQETIIVNEALTHYLYPSLGLDIALSRDRKEVFQYVPPTEFSRLRAPLLAP